MDRSTQVGQADERSWPVVETLQSSALALTMTAIGFAPRALPMLLCTCAGLTLIQALVVSAANGGGPRDIARQIMQPRPMRLALALLGFAALSVLWASDRSLALLSVAQALAVVLAIGVLAGLLPPQLAELPSTRYRRFVRSVAIGGGISIAFILFELVTNNVLSLAVISRFPALIGDSTKEVVRESDRIIGLLPFYLDRNVAALALTAPAIIAATLIWSRPANAAPAAIVLLVAVVALIFISESEASKLAAMVGAAAALAVAWRPRATVRTIQMALVAGIVLALPIGHLPSALGFERAAWLPPSARERAMIWDRTATAVRRAPILGIGVQSTRFQSSPAYTQIEGVHGRRRELGWHAHNFVLQTWLEFGAVGALLLLALGLSLVREAARSEPFLQPATVATLAAAMAIAVAGWGIWQPWLLAAMGTAIAGLAVTRARSANAGDALQG